MEDFFFDGKCDLIDLVPTNASHHDKKSREKSVAKKKGSLRSTSVVRATLDLDLKGFKPSGRVTTARCQTSCRMSQR